MRIESIRELKVLAINNWEVHSILNDRSIGRKKATELIQNETGDVVSEKLVRTWREKSEEDAKPYVGVSTTHFVPQLETVPATPTGTTVMQQALKVYENHELGDFAFSTPPVHNHEDRIGRYTDQTPVGPAQAIKDIPRKRPMTKTSKTIVIMPDVQAPLHDEKLVNKFIQFLADYEPDELGQVGDFTDSTEISRWVRGKKGEYAGDLAGGFRTSKAILGAIREVFDGRFRIVRSNHDDRLELYIDGCAAGLASLMDEELNIEYLAGFNQYGVEFIRDEVVELTPQARDPWLMCHGDEGSLSPVAGKTAFNLAKNKFGANVVCGHTHRAGLTGETYGYNGKNHTLRQGLEVGHFMDITKADYLKKKGVAANWQQSFGILHIHGSKVYPQLVQVDYDGEFSVEGKLY